MRCHRSQRRLDPAKMLDQQVRIRFIADASTTLRGKNSRPGKYGSVKMESMNRKSEAA
jgi:hypothetical protein